MRTSRIHIDQPISMNSELEMPADKVHYIKNVLRLKNGQSLIVFNGRDSTDYTAELQIEGKRIRLRVISALSKDADSSTNISIVQAAGKAEHMDFVTQKATELGVASLIYFNAERTQTPFRHPRLNKKLVHWQGIAESACEQCGRNHVPKLSFCPDLGSCLDGLPQAQRLMLDFNGQSLDSVSKSLTTTNPFQLLIGPEGGLCPEEIEQASLAGFTGLRLGPRTLRMETAAISILTLVQHYFGDLQ